VATHDRAAADRILDAAAGLFSEYGFRKVTVREICRAAEVNVAAVNYHFGDKLGLYRQVIENAIAAMKETNELSVAAGLGGSPEEQLRAYVRVFITRTTGTDQPSRIHKLMRHEMEDPTDAFDLIIRDAFEPRHRYLAGIVSELSGWPADDVRVLRVVAGLQGQCLIYVRPIPSRAPAEWRSLVKDLDAVVEHIAAFTIAGIKGLESYMPGGVNRPSAASQPPSATSNVPVT
jgi:TetR/AcrR family transcriptional regulator, regulator of cefoperazone and chloramphenicol sensitivity